MHLDQLEFRVDAVYLRSPMESKPNRKSDSIPIYLHHWAVHPAVE